MGGGRKEVIVIRTYQKEAGQFAGITSAVDFELLKKRIRLYYKNVGQVKARLYSGEIISLPFVTLQKDRRCRDIKVSNERRRRPIN